VNDAVCFRTPDTVLGWWEDQYKVSDISAAVMKKHFEKIEPRISVSEVKPYELNKNSRILKGGCEKLGWAAAPNKRNCKQCRQCGLCTSAATMGRSRACSRPT